MALPHPVKVGFLASHGGSAMRTIISAIGTGYLKNTEATILISNNRSCEAMYWAKIHHLQTFHLNTILMDGEARRVDDVMTSLFEMADANLIVLSGYMRKVGPKMLARWPRNIINIHPSLLPSHGGQGMYGRRVHESVIARRDTQTGCTVHRVDDYYDHGEILAQATIDVDQSWPIEMLEHHVRVEEHALILRVMHNIEKGLYF